MRAYSVLGPSNSQAAPATILTIIAATTVRPAIFETVISTSITPANQAALYTAGRFTAAGTTTGYTPDPLDPNDVASVTTAGITATVEPTYTASKSLLQFGLNQQATFRWVASPGCELKSPATASNGIGWCQTTSTTTFVAQANTFFFE